MDNREEARLLAKFRLGVEHVVRFSDRSISKAMFLDVIHWKAGVRYLIKTSDGHYFIAMERRNDNGQLYLVQQNTKPVETNENVRLEIEQFKGGPYITS